MSVPTCDHLKEDGVFCNSPALNGRHYCYFHLNLRGRRLKSARARRRGDNPALNLPFPEDMHAVQVSLAEILWAIAERRIDHKAAGLMLYTLQQASTNLNQTPRWHGEREAVPSGRPLRALNLPDLEKRFGLPDDVDLDADPEADPAENIGCPTPAGVAGVGLCVGGQHPPSVGKCGTDDECPNPSTSVATEACPPVATSPDRVPFPEDEVEALEMTLAEQMEFFSHCMQYGILGDEDKVKMNWLRAKRAGLLDLTEEDREKHAAYELMAQPPRSRAQDAA
jgi:hypothetical protein